MEKIPNTELLIMQAIWNNKPPMSTSDIREVLQMERPWNLSALQTLLGRLVKRDFLRTYKDGKNRYYEPLVSEREYLTNNNSQYFKKWHKASLKDFVACLFESNSVTLEDLEELKAFIDEKTKEGRL